MHRYFEKKEYGRGKLALQSIDFKKRFGGVQHGG